MQYKALAIKHSIKNILTLEHLKIIALKLLLQKNNIHIYGNYFFNK